MLSRLILLFLAAVCITMNVFVWRAEYGSKDNEMPVPEALVWKKIMTAPEASSLNVFQGGKRTGFCEFSTGVGQEMAQMDENKPPPEGLFNRINYQIHINGNASLGDFTNRIKFDGHLQFASNRKWESMDLRVLMRNVSIQLQSAASNQAVHITIVSDGVPTQRTLTFAELNDPNKLLRSLMDDFGGPLAGFMAGMEFPMLPADQSGVAGGIQWDAERTRILFGHEPVPVFRLETRILDRPIVIVTSTLGEILRVELPGDVVATLDEWGKP
jgi:hypothetical protein